MEYPFSNDFTSVRAINHSIDPLYSLFSILYSLFSTRACLQAISVHGRDGTSLSRLGAGGASSVGPLRLPVPVLFYSLRLPLNCAVSHYGPWIFLVFGMF
jgi:hypothetical protein